ncbi:YEATS domain-containing protein, putative [Perkinsus marinus ATCC 50983]|uniref:YEATS domain-containing protein, putative n=1 Tax=Perkinsus marinus (strain ATCC 50983 / TXsc) TaxID=423536 RepID=C5KB12_PERM5|nr:YEATS domain-containing protein, putative [Perkinsus marinus ATCC 50983]EER18338.1 YEATS domain-containing protein, putative [Perkinsus marinus ATCC 50983]|eukprot:XP_002786542.1 YEATS domain-containing protein, putative [Perkinsus marinus ATCC 50983]
MAHRLIGATLDVPIVVGTYAFKKDENLYRWHALVRSGQLGAPLEDLSYIIKRVDFQLHETFSVPQRTVESTPFMVTEEGWGEFDIVITIHFVDSSEAPVQTTHKLKLHHDANTTGINPGASPVVPVESSSEDEKRYAVVNEAYMELHFEHPHAWFYDAVQRHREEHKIPVALTDRPSWMTDAIKASFDAITPFFQEFDDREEFEYLSEMEAFVDQQIALLQMQSSMAETDYRTLHYHIFQCQSRLRDLEDSLSSMHGGRVNSEFGDLAEVRSTASRKRIRVKK